MTAKPFGKDGEWWVSIHVDGVDEEELAGPFDSELDAVEMARRWSQ